MPFKKCHKCGAEYLAKTDDQVLCKPGCQGRQIQQMDVITAEAESSSLGFFIFFLIACAVTYYCYTNAYEVELYLIRNDVLRETMANKLAKSMPDSFSFVNDGLADPDLNVAIACLKGLNENVTSIPQDLPEIQTFVSLLKAIYEDPDEDLELKKVSVGALGLVKSPEIVEILMTAINDPKYVNSAVIAMQKIGDERFIGPLNEIIIDERREFVGTMVKYHAVTALGLIDEQNGEIMPGLLVAFRDMGSGSVRDEALTGIVRFCKRFNSLSISGKEAAVKGLRSMRRYCKSDTLFRIRERGQEEIPLVERIMKP